MTTTFTEPAVPPKPASQPGRIWVLLYCCSCPGLHWVLFRRGSKISVAVTVAACPACGNCNLVQTEAFNVKRSA